MANQDISQILRAIENQNKELERLIEENQRLASSPYDLTSIERLQVLSKETREYFQQLEETLKDTNEELVKIDSVKYGNFFKNSKNILKDIKELKKNIKELREAGDNDTAEKLEKKLNDVRSAASVYYRQANREQEALNKRIVEGTHSLDDFGEKMEQRTRALRKGMGEISNGSKQVFNSFKKALEPWAKANHEAMTYARTMGMSQKTADKYLSNTVSWAAKNNIGVLFNKTTDELIKMQGKYSEVLGRNVQLTSEQKKDMLAMEKFLGEDGMMDIANNLENFGLGMSDSAEFIHKTMNEATKSGITASKLTKTIRENIHMAQNYSFKNGLDGLTNMTKKAIALKTDMSLINGFIDKTSTVEGAITTGANLQVLGGSYAAASDPLSMLYESLNDVGGLWDRALQMVKGKVFYDNKTGRFDMTSFDRRIMKEAATQMGIDPNKLINAAFRDASLSKIEGQVKNSDIANDAEMVELVKNLATWDKGNAVINIDGVDKKVSELKASDKAKLEAMQRTDSQNLQDMAISLRSMNDIMSGVQKESNNEQAKATEWAATGINGLLRQNTELLNTVAKISAWSNIIGSGIGILGGVWTTAYGVMRLGKGIGNLGRGFSPYTNINKRSTYGTTSSLNDVKSGLFRGGYKTVYQGKNTGKMYHKVKGGFKEIGNPSARVVNPVIGGKVNPLMKGLKVGGAGALIGAGLSISTDIATGEFKKDIEGSLTRAAGPAIGSIIGGVFGGPVGAFIGGWLGQTITGAIQDTQKETRGKIREEIASRLISTTPALAGLFSGPNALEGNYSESQLRKLEKALSDGIIDNSDDLGWFLKRKLRNNNDFNKIQEQGIKVHIAMAKGGYLDGLRHNEGGMPILGSNISVEGGEFVMNRESTKVLRPYLERMNKGDYSMISKEPLGKQMTVHRNHSFGLDMPHNSKLNINPISINISGTIKLDSGNKQVDITNELLNNPQLVSKLTDIITKQINILDNNAYNKGSFKQKFT